MATRRRAIPPLPMDRFPAFNGDKGLNSFRSSQDCCQIEFGLP
jgi:hypothetical protein